MMIICKARIVMNEYNTLNDVIENAFSKYPDQICMRWRESDVDAKEQKTYREIDFITSEIGVGLIFLGVEKGSHVALIADVSSYWTICNIALQRIGAVDIPRASDTPSDELGYILKHSGAEFVIVDNEEQIKKINQSKHKTKIKKYILLKGTPKKKDNDIITLNDIIQIGKNHRNEKSKIFQTWMKYNQKINPKDVSAILYTSGTSGIPKGVVLTQANLSSQINYLHPKVRPQKKKEGLVILPPWHIMGRMMEYFFLEAGCTLNYTDIKNLGQDLKEVKPHYIPAVPRIWEGVYNKIWFNLKSNKKDNLFSSFFKMSLALLRQKKIIGGWENFSSQKNPLSINILFRKGAAAFKILLLWIPHIFADFLIYNKIRKATGGRMIFSVSGGSKLPLKVEEFFNAIGLPVIEGYGLTETGIVTTSILNETSLNTAGRVYPKTKIKILDSHGQDVTEVPGAKGTLYVKGPSVMQGYFKDSKTTSERFKNGWFNTEDLVFQTSQKEIVIIGRSSDTIVLKSGENVEPSPIEDALRQNSMIDNVVVIGHNQKNLGALIVPSSEYLKTLASQIGIQGDSISEWIKDTFVINQYRKLLKNVISTENGFKNYERVTVFALLDKPFEVGKEMNNALKVKRHVVEELYKNKIKDMYKKTGQKVY